jgi:hypothetical protein
LTYDLSAGHRIAPGAEAKAWAAEIAERLGTRPLRVLELACGTGEITGVLHGLGHEDERFRSSSVTRRSRAPFATSVSMSKMP